MLFRRGPQIYTVPEFLTPITASTARGPVAFRWPRDVFVSSVLVLPTSGVRADMAGLRLRIQDETYADIIGDSLGSVGAGVLALCGNVSLDITPAIALRRAFVLQRPVIGGDQWRITVTNENADAVGAEVLFSIEVPSA